MMFVNSIVLLVGKRYLNGMKKLKKKLKEICHLIFLSWRTRNALNPREAHQKNPMNTLVYQQVESWMNILRLIWFPNLR